MLEVNSVLSLNSYLKPQAPWVLALGNFDGVHLGHQALLKALETRGEVLNCQKALVTFEPHPREFFYLQKHPGSWWPRVWGPWDLRHYLKSRKIDALVEIPFDLEFSQLEAEEFLKLMIEPLSPRALVVGHDFAFGRNRTGGLPLLREYGRRCGCEILVVEAISLGEERVSTTQIKKLLGTPDLRGAEAMMGRRVSLGGEVIAGRALAKGLGYPTANISLKHRSALALGVYAIRGGPPEQGSFWPGVANLGFTPTLQASESGSVPKFEVHFFDLTRNLYGKDLFIEFLEYIRPEMKFRSVDELKDQIGKDCHQARKYFL